MPKLRFSCPNCKQTIEGDNSSGGKSIDCPTCGANIIVPMPWAPTEETVDGSEDIDHELLGLYGQLESTAKEVRALPEFNQARPTRGQGLKAFLGRAGGALRLIFAEKEIIVFSLLQWAAIGVAYYIWVQILGWIPEDVWANSEKSDGVSLVDIALYLWSLFCIGLAAFPLGILSGCMGAAHFLTRQGQECTIARCLKIVMPRAFRLWAFHWVDAAYTCHRILERVPGERARKRSRVLSEGLYYAWKLGTAGIMPGLVLGKGLLTASKESVILVKNRFFDLALLRIGYSGLCWVVGTLAYIGTIYLFLVTDTFEKTSDQAEGIQIHYFYKMAGVPILVAVGVVLLFLRPLFVLSLCDIYAEDMEQRGEPIELANAPSRGTAALIAFGILALILLVGGFYLKAFLSR